ncbi:Mitochondrial chaperone BCS1 [Tetrabaena socialis]|uniref:Mitochondrial chaperone BCS1 n=1 Tax=Tetrabaena socialis TaxID=47790 RepID=A0A2J7ZLR9_9CHLO|nr:Mitochondrial chaperone BCS1 [Tetrabaena socialis]|eukprot:PNH01200.1 Mitochondrial chaperone BCS1 [Tetrabaena socialis]
MLVFELVASDGLPLDQHIAFINHIANAARREYDSFFGAYGMRVYYTRKEYERVTWNLFGTLPYRELSTVSLPNDLGTKIMADVMKFNGDSHVYKRIGRPYKRVYCLHGPPGTGKTSLVMAIASELRRPLAIFNVDSLRDDTFIELISSRPNDAVLMFEDVDVLFKESKKDSGGMTLSTLLNSLDGVLHPSGALVFLTTNHIDRLDSALTRPGRLDYVVEIGYSTPEQRVALWQAIFPTTPAPAVLARKDLPNITPAWLSANLLEMRDAGPEEAARALMMLLLKVEAPDAVPEKKKKKKKVPARS